MTTLILYLRAYLFYLGMAILTLLFTMLILLMFPLPAVLRSRIASGWAYSMVWWLKVTCKLSVSITGREHIPTSPSIILAKHQSAWETIAFQTIFPPQIWVLKKELFMIPFFGWSLWALGSIGIDRSAGRQAIKQMVAQGKHRLARGLWVVVFPEGTRTEPGTRGKYHIGGAWIASHTQTQVVPVAHNAGRFWRKSSIIKHPGTIQVVIGKPIDTTGLKADELNSLVETWIEQQMQSL